MGEYTLSVEKIMKKQSNNISPVSVTYRSAVLVGAGQTKKVPCTVAAIDRALSEPGSGGWSWCLDELTQEQAEALGVYETAYGARVLELPSVGPIIVRVEP